MIKSEVLLDGLRFPEGPVFDRDGNLWFVEIQGGNLSHWDGKTLTRFDVDGTPNGAVIDREGGIWFCDSGRGEIRTFDPNKQVFSTICNKCQDGERLQRPNDLLFDDRGNLLFSDHADGRTEPISTICVLPKGSSEAKVVSDKKYFTNGIAISKDGKNIVFAETYKQRLWIGQWDSDLMELKNEIAFIEVGTSPFGPDGMALDEDENLYVAVFEESRICVYNKDGNFLYDIKCEGKRPTSCAFDPTRKLGLVATEADLGQIISFDVNAVGLDLYHLTK